MKNDELKERMNRLEGICLFLRMACLIPIAILALAILLSIHQSSWDHFSRAGSLIVVLGIFITVMDLSGAIYDRTISGQLTLSEVLEITNAPTLDEENMESLFEKAKSIDDKADVSVHSTAFYPA